MSSTEAKKSAPEQRGPATDVKSVLARVERPPRAVVTAGMPYANGPLHLGHLAGAHVPADVYARYLGLLIGRQNVLFVCGTDEHGSTSEVSALQANKPIRQFIDEIHDKQTATLARFDIGLDIYTGTSRPETFPTHTALSQDILRKLHANGLLEKRTSKQWFDAKANRFLPDRLVRGTCPFCAYENAYSDECDNCGHQYDPTQLLNPRSAVSDATPEMRDTTHWFLDMAKVQEPLLAWLKTKTKKWRKLVSQIALELVSPSISFENTHEAQYKELKATLPKHSSRYAPGKRVALVFDTFADLEKARAALPFATTIADTWAHRSITRDIAWGIPLPDIDADLKGKTLYVWPDSLIAPISFSKVARKDGEDFWRDPKARLVQFLGQDNVFFYVVMQGAMWIGSQADIHRQPIAGELQLTDVIGACHLMVNGEKMSKSRGNFFTGDQLLDEKGYSADQIRYYLALLDLSEKPSDFDFKKLDDRNHFLGGVLNAAFERPISAAHSKFDGKVPDGKMLPDAEKELVRVVERYVKSMERADYSNLLTEHVEKLARTINALGARYKPHDDRAPLNERTDALFTQFALLKSLMILLYPFVPSTMEKLRASLNLPASVWTVDELGVPLAAGHAIGSKAQYFPSVAEASTSPSESP